MCYSTTWHNNHKDIKLNATVYDKRRTIWLYGIAIYDYMYRIAYM